MLLLHQQTSARLSEALSPPIGFTVSVEPSPASRQSSAEPLIATHSAQVPPAVSW